MAQRILVVDDEASIRALYQQELADEGYEVETAGSATEASRRVDAWRPDLMILDIEMPDKDGLSYLRQLMQSHRELPVLICSAYSRYKDDFASWMADAYLVKSADLGPLKRKVREILAAGAHKE